MFSLFSFHTIGLPAPEIPSFKRFVKWWQAHGTSVPLNYLIDFADKMIAT